MGGEGGELRSGFFTQAHSVDQRRVIFARPTIFPVRYRLADRIVDVCPVYSLIDKEYTL